MAAESYDVIADLPSMFDVVADHVQLDPDHVPFDPDHVQ
jgi:hypothetical protein